MFAAAMGHGETVQLLLDHRADVKIADKDGATALAWARKEGHQNIAKMLQSK